MVLLFGIGWAAMMGIPYSNGLKNCNPQKKGEGFIWEFVNMMIVIPMGIQTLQLLVLLFKNLLGANAATMGNVFSLGYLLYDISLCLGPSTQMLPKAKDEGVAT